MKSILIGCDNAATQLKEAIVATLAQKGYAVEDIGCADSCDTTAYPVIAKRLCDKIIESGYSRRGILLCGTGLGMCIAANKIKGIRATVCHDSYSAERSILSNDANVLCMGERVIGRELAKMLAAQWLSLTFIDGPSTEKVQAIQAIEAETMR